MGIQSTIILTRKEAEDRLVDKILEGKREGLAKQIKSWADEEIEAELESAFDNYLIED